ncbi:transcriptional regulator with XRE-family HTH domain [Thermocatellispora tengchongensis]|uniref:Transcriptional regulator with XRE-family HTH domain n=1 Tax=Thermocatellispora tengchongensis TaxID=1073253 RepID=A0A840PMS8_9ACTN|nr:helix-turn-helix transcriptional regulator [Thermocatellispora tengchongensis]MBB5139323.1 transcriptional regulator with XRE-family HTH domain [Thermocatellispora tengchongensis]
MDARSLPEALKLIMQQRGWTQTQLAKELNTSQTWVSQITLGHKDTGIAKAITLLARVDWEVVIRPKREGPVKRREFNTKIAQSAAGVILIPSAKTDAFQDPEYVHALADRAASTRHELGGHPVLPSLLGQVRRTESAVHGTDQKLQAAASRLAREAMLALYDAQRYDEAERIGQFSLALARRAKDYPAQATAYTILSQINTHQGIGDRGAVYAERALQLPDLSNANKAYVRIRLGRALSLVPGKERQARTMLDQARSLDGIPAFEAADVAGNVAIALDRLHLHHEAHSTFDETVSRMGQWSTLYRAQYLAHQTKAAVRARELSLAADLMHTFAAILPFLASARTHSLAQEILSTSAAWANVREVRDARQQLQAAVSSMPSPRSTKPTSA